MSLLRTGHRPEDWLDQGPSEPLAPKRISGSLVIGSPGPMELQRRNQRKSKAKLTRNQATLDDRPVQPGRPRLSEDVTLIGQGKRPGYASEEERIAARRQTWRESKNRKRQAA